VAREEGETGSLLEGAGPSLQQTGKVGPPERRGETVLCQRLLQETRSWQPALQQLLPITLMLSEGSELTETELERRKLPARMKGEIVYKSFLFLF